MPSSRCVFSTAAALHRVFIAPIEQCQLRFTRSVSPCKLSSFSTPCHRLLLSIQQQRCYAAPAPAKRRLPRDDEIKSWSVSLVSEDGTLNDPRSTSEILSSIDRKIDSLVVVVPGEPGVPPICKIMNKQAMREAEKARGKASRSSGTTVKTIELNWAIDGNDLGHRLNRMREFLGRGNKVEVVMAGKRKGRKASESEAQELLKKIREVVGGVEGARETKPMEGKLLGTATIYAEGKPVQKQ